MDEEVKDTSTEGVQPNGVLVTVERKPSGDVGVAVQTLGDVRVTEVDTILRIALKELKEALGL